nr:dTDP-4-amino-4,6-dideoxygalactose transaminase [Vibrio mimicus]
MEFIGDVFKQNKFYGNGKYTNLCTRFIEKRLSAQKVLLTDSCTSALEIVALLLRDFDLEQEIILPSYTFSSTASAFARAGFKLVFAEIDPKTMMLDLDDAKRKITRKTIAIVSVHYAGQCCNIEELMSLCSENNLKLVEDAAQAFDSYLNNKALGTYGDFGCFSFHETKNIHAGLSGALVIGDKKYNDRATHIWERGTNRQEVLKGIVDKYSWVEIGGSFYPTELQAAFLYAQLQGLDQNKAKRKIIYDAYLNSFKLLKSQKKLYFPIYSDVYESNYHAFYIQLATEDLCDNVREYLLENQVSAYIGYVPLHSSRVGMSMGYKPDSLPITEECSKRVLRLPFHNNLTEDDVNYIATLVAKCLG